MTVIPWRHLKENATSTRRSEEPLTNLLTMMQPLGQSAQERTGSPSLETTTIRLREIGGK
jgi:hypothetical protein